MSPARPLRITTPDDRTIVLEREFAAPRQLVFDAWTRPDLLRRWYGAAGWRLVECEVDLRVDGAWRFVSRGPGGAVMGQRGVYREIAPPARLSYTELFDDQSYPGVALVTHDLVEAGGETTVTSTVRYPSPEAREAVLRYPMRRGLAESYRRLDALLRIGRRTDMNWTLEVVMVPVSDLDRAKAFYADRVGFHVDHDVRASGGVRIVQLTPPGSGCSIVLSKGMADMAPGSLKGLQLVVPDLPKARAQLVERGVDVTEIQLYDQDGPRPAREDDNLDNAGFVYFNDPDGNAWAVQQISDRAG